MMAYGNRIEQDVKEQQQQEMENGLDSAPSGSTMRDNETSVWVGAFERVMGDQMDTYKKPVQQQQDAKHGGTDPFTPAAQPPSEHAFGVNRLGSPPLQTPGQTTMATAAAEPQLQKTPQKQRVTGSTQYSPRAASANAPSISITPSVLDFGMVNVGARKSAYFTVRNHSEQSDVRVQLRYVSKVISMNREEIVIPPLQTVELRVDFFPRRVNEQYRKQVTVTNLLNRANDQILEVRSTNVDGQRIGFHSLFYRILTPTGSNFVDFGDVNINCTRLRSFGIENVSSAPLSLELSSANTEDLKLYVKCESSSSSAGASRRSSVTKYSIDDGTASLPSSEDAATRLMTSKAKRTAHLKEKFLDSMNYDVPASARNENKSWRLAQKQSHVVKGSHHASRNEAKKEPQKKPHINLVAALKKGGKGRLTQRYGKSITFKDRCLLSEFEYLDLATGPPVDGKRISAKSRKYHTLDVAETGKSSSSSRKRTVTELPSENTVPSTVAASSNATTINARALAGANDARRDHGSDTDSRRHSPALTGKRKAAPMLHDAIDVSELSLDELVAAVEAQNSSLSTVFLSNARAEEQLVRTEVNLQRELRSAIDEGRLLPVDVLTLEPHEEKQVLAIYTPNGVTRPHIQGYARKQDSRIFIRLVDFNTTALGHVKEDFSKLLQQSDRDELPVRDLMVKSNLCRSLMELSQPHINFGHVQKGETKTRKIIVQNRGELALRYCIRKSGSIASGDIKLRSADRYGIVPGHGKREVEFVFCPSLTGPFQERLTVENVADRDRDEMILIKANVTRVSNFSVDPSSISFSPAEEDKTTALPIGSLCPIVQSFVLNNLSGKSRSFAVHVDSDDLRHGAYHVEVILSANTQDDAVKATLTNAEEEEVEHISQKLRIASRKGQVDKVKKYHDRLNELGVPVDASLPSQDAASGEGDAATGDEHDGDRQRASDSAAAVPTSVVRVASTVHMQVAAQQSKRFYVRLRPMRVAQPEAEHQYHHHAFDVRIPIQVHESKNIDEVQIVEVRCRVQAAADGAATATEGSDACEGVSKLTKATSALVIDSHAPLDGSLIVRLPANEEAMALFSSQRNLSNTTTAAPSPTHEEQPSPVS